MAEFIIIVIGIIMICGYAMNIVKLSQSKAFCGMDALRVVGIFFPPMGSIFGFCK